MKFVRPELYRLLENAQANATSKIPWLRTAMNTMLHVLLIASLLLFIVSIVKLTMETSDGIEKAIRAMALFTGALIVVGTQSSGKSYADFIINSLANSKPFTFGLFGVALPGAGGAALSWYALRAVKRSENVAVRFLGLFGMLAVTQFAVMYGVAVSDRGYDIGKTAIPNISFIVGLFVYLVFNYDAGPQRDGSRLPGLMKALRNKMKALRNKKQPQTRRQSLFED